MAVLEESMASSTRENTKKNSKNKKKKILLVAQELKLARILAGNNKTARDRALKSLKKWFQNRATAMPFSEDDFLRLWKGLFYSMWMSDKSLIQEDCAENIASLVHSLPLENALLFYKAGMTILMNEWFGIDQLRLDKFLMFVRRLLRQVLFVIRNLQWSRESIQKFSAILSETILDSKRTKPLGLLLHFVEIYLEELAKVSNGELPPQSMTLFVEPFIKQLAFATDFRIINHINKHVFIYLMRQSDLGLEYNEKYQAWSKLGFPGSIDSMKKVRDAVLVSKKKEEVEIEENKVYDPRAGRVDVDLPQLKFHGKAIAKALSAHIFINGTNSKSRKCLSRLSELFKKFASGVYPLGVKTIKLATDNYDTSIKKAVNRLVKFDKKIMGKKNKKRKRQPEVDDCIELRGGKKIKLDESLRKKLAEELESIMNNPDKINKILRAKRKKLEITQDIPKKQAKTSNQSTIDLDAKIESIFKRNSGIWTVTRLFKSEETKSEDSEQILYPKNFESPLLNFDKTSLTLVANSANSTPTTSNAPKFTINRSTGDSPIASEAVTPTLTTNCVSKRNSIISNSVKAKRLSLPPQLLVNPYATPNSSSAKKVKINTKLNSSQDVQEHHAKIKSSPAIPYDATKRPLKPLLKTPTMTSPINPFYLI